jgi:predicted RNase H-like HicB family nuclease
MKYPIVIHKDKDSDYGVTVPDIPGCYSAGYSYDDALQNAVEAIECHLEGLLLDDEILPMASPIDTWINHKDFKDGVFALVDVDLSQITGKVKRVNITLPERVLMLIDLYGKTHAMKNRSAFLTDAALAYIAQHQ